MTSSTSTQSKDRYGDSFDDIKEQSQSAHTSGYGGAFLNSMASNAPSDDVSNFSKNVFKLGCLS